MIFFTKKSAFGPIKGSGPTIENRPSTVFPQKIFFIISLLFALLLLATSYVRAADNTIPGTPGLISGQINVCAYVGNGQTTSYSISAVAGAELYLWTVPPTAQIVSGQGTTSISVSFSPGFTGAANKQIKVRAISQGGTSADRSLYLLTQQPSTPASIAGPSNACIYIGTTNPATYSTAKDPAATSYIWAADPTKTVITHPNGSGPNDTIIRVVFKGGYRTNPITVQAVNNCGFSASRAVTVSGAAPSTPGIITGPTNGCAYMLPNGAVATYSIAPVAGAASYIWTTPANCVVNHPNGGGSNDVVITVQFPGDFTGGAIQVVASSGCEDSSPRTLSVSKLNPSTPGVITPVEKTICPAREYSYTLPSMPSNATLVNWTVPVDALSFSGQGTSSITVQYPETLVSGIVTATGVSNCASSATRQLPVTLYRCQQERGTSGRGNTEQGRGAKQNNNQQKKIGETQINEGTETLIINVAPNPSKGNFKIQVNTKDKAAISVKLLDLQGREIKKMTMPQGQPLLFGSELRPGTYILEVSQGKVKRTEKLLRL